PLSPARLSAWAMIQRRLQPATCIGLAPYQAADSQSHRWLASRASAFAGRDLILACRRGLSAGGFGARAAYARRTDRAGWAAGVSLATVAYGGACGIATLVSN